MDYIAELNLDLTKGFSKSGLEKLIGLPQNCLSGVLKGDKKLSKKSELKIEAWSKSEKPNPLNFIAPIVENMVIAEKAIRDLAKRNNTNPQNDYKGFPIKADVVVIENPIFDTDSIKKQIQAILAEKIPSHRDTSIGRKSWKIEQQNKINELKEKLG